MNMMGQNLKKKNDDGEDEDNERDNQEDDGREDDEVNSTDCKKEHFWNFVREETDIPKDDKTELLGKYVIFMFYSFTVSKAVNSIDHSTASASTCVCVPDTCHHLPVTQIWSQCKQS